MSPKHHFTSLTAKASERMLTTTIEDDDDVLQISGKCVVHAPYQITTLITNRLGSKLLSSLLTPPRFVLFCFVFLPSLSLSQAVTVNTVST